MKRISTYLFGLLILAMLTTCKKYEDYKWYKKAKKTRFFTGQKLTRYEVNGIDSLPLLDIYLGARATPKKVSKVYFIYGEFGEEPSATFGVSTMGVYPIEIPNQYKKHRQIAITFGRYGKFDTAIFKRNLFVDNSTLWNVLEMSENDKRIISKTVNGNTYILQFEN